MARVANMNRTMPQMAVANGKKDMGQTTSSVNLASKATATSMSGTQNKTAMSQTAFGQTSPFRDTTQKGIVSGMGMLTFWKRNIIVYAYLLEIFWQERGEHYTIFHNFK